MCLVISNIVLVKLLMWTINIDKLLLNYDMKILCYESSFSYKVHTLLGPTKYIIL